MVGKCIRVKPASQNQLRAFQMCSGYAEYTRWALVSMILIIVVRACGKLQLIFIVSNRYHAHIYFYICIYIYILDESHEGWSPMRFRSLTTDCSYLIIGFSFPITYGSFPVTFRTSNFRPRTSNFSPWISALRIQLSNAEHGVAADLSCFIM